MRGFTNINAAIKFIIILGLVYSFKARGQDLSVHFPTGSATLSAVEKGRLDSLVRSLETELSYHIKLSGHTDSIGSLAYNKSLSERRADAVRKYLSGKRRIKAIIKSGNAFLSPVESNVKEDGRSKNRRCDIYIEKIMTGPGNWKIPVQSFSINNQAKNILHTKNGCKVIVDKGSFKVKDDDTLSIYITEYNDPVDFIAGGLPMSYSLKGRTTMYQSEQMMKIEACIGNTPVQLMKLIGLDCPNVDTSNGVRLYEFHGNEDKEFKVSSKIIAGRVEVVKEEIPEVKREEIELQEVRKSQINPPVAKKESIKVSDNKKKPKELKRKAAIKHALKVKTTSGLSEEESILEVARKKYKAEIKLEPDTGKGFVIDPDTGRISVFSYISGSGENKRIDGKTCLDFKECDNNFCDKETFRKMVNFGMQFKNKQFNVDYDIDLTPFNARYKYLNYDGMKLKCLKNPEDMFTVKARVKKRLLRKELILKLTSFKDNPEYESLKSVKWIIRYGFQSQNLQVLKNLKISDFKVARLNPTDYGRNRKVGFYVELKSDMVFYRCDAKPKWENKKFENNFSIYEKEYIKRATAFDDSLIDYVNKNKAGIKDLLCLYDFTESFSSSFEKKIRCSKIVVPACYPFSFFKSDQDHVAKCSRLQKCRFPEGANFRCRYDCFPDWLRYYDEHMAELQGQFEEIKNYPESLWDCQCKRDPEPVSKDDDPCYKWKHVDANSIGNTITMIGLGIYNFDSEMALEKKQYIKNAVYLNEEGDTLFKCPLTKTVQGALKKKCGHKTYTIIPGFNGLMQQNHTETLVLLPGKENLLYFTKYNRRYKIYLDLRNVETYKSQVFILKDITEQSTTMDDLRKELLKD